MAHYPGSLNQLVRFLSDIPDWNSLDKSVLDHTLQGLPVLIPGPALRGISLQEAIKVRTPPSTYDIVYDIIYNILYDVPIQDGLVPPLQSEEASGLISGCENVLGRLLLLLCYLQREPLQHYSSFFVHAVPAGAAADSRPDSGTGSRLFEFNIWMWRYGRAFPRKISGRMRKRCCGIGYKKQDGRGLKP